MNALYSQILAYVMTPAGLATGVGVLWSAVRALWPTKTPANLPHDIAKILRNLSDISTAVGVALDNLTVQNVAPPAVVPAAPPPAAQ